MVEKKIEKLCASGVQLSGRTRQQVLRSVLRGLRESSVYCVQLPACVVWRR